MNEVPSEQVVDAYRKMLRHAGLLLCCWYQPSAPIGKSTVRWSSQQMWQNASNCSRRLPFDLMLVMGLVVVGIS